MALCQFQQEHPLTFGHANPGIGMDGKRRLSATALTVTPIGNMIHGAWFEALSHCQPPGHRSDAFGRQPSPPRDAAFDALPTAVRRNNADVIQ